MFDHWIYKNNFRFKNIASTDDEHIDFYLNHYSVGCFTSRQDKAGLRDRIHREVTSRPDEIKLNRHELIYTG